MAEKRMEFEEINPNVWKPEQEGDSVEGVLVTRIIGNENNSNRYYIENAGNRYMLWGSSVLDERMQLVACGQYVKITYNGTKPLEKGKTLKLFKVEVAKDTKEE